MIIVRIKAQNKKKDYVELLKLMTLKYINI
jgi:hypothetical protein